MNGLRAYTGLKNHGYLFSIGVYFLLVWILLKEVWALMPFFYSFVHSRTTLQEFVVKFEKVVDCRLEVEKREDYKSRHKSRILSTSSKLEHHAAFVYTRNVFGKFQDELRKINKFTKKRITRDGPSYAYQVSSWYDARDTFIVNVDLDSKVAKCDCHLFEFIGILCRHILVFFSSKRGCLNSRSFCFATLDEGC